MQYRLWMSAAAEEDAHTVAGALSLAAALARNHVPGSRERIKNFAAASIRPTVLEAGAMPHSSADARSTQLWESPISEAFRKRPHASR